MPKGSRWPVLQGEAKQPTIAKLIDDAMVAIERDNKTLKGVLPKNYARQELDKQRLGEIIGRLHISYLPYSASCLYKAIQNPQTFIY